MAASRHPGESRGPGVTLRIRYGVPPIMKLLITTSAPRGMQTALQVMNIPIYEKAVSVWGTYSDDFFRFRHIFLSQKRKLSLTFVEVERPRLALS